MKKFLRENPTIAFGLGLPLLLVIVFLLISGVPALLVAPPQFDVLYATNYNYNYPNGIQISVVNQRVQVNYLGSSQAYQNPRLWRYSVKTGAVREIAIMLPAGLAPVGQVTAPAETPLKVTAIDVPDLDGVTIDTSSIAPDGYQFSSCDNYSHRVFTGLFYSSHYRDQAELTKNGRSIRLPNADGVYYGNQTHFIGWVVSP
ncbi:MAG: hypothetical protein ACSLFC_10355 [Desulfuromonadales bacterium]